MSEAQAAPRIYDVEIDAIRDVTQADVDFLVSHAGAHGMIGRTLFALMRLQTLLPNGLVDREEVRETCERLQDLALVSQATRRSCFLGEGEVSELLKNKDEA